MPSYRRTIGKNIPPLPKTLAECNKVMSKEFKVINQIETSSYGTTSESSLILECPFCSYQFGAVGSEGCFHSSIEPHNCPNCRFPEGLLTHLLNLAREEKTVKSVSN